jgi:RecA/RadA recombinase
MIYGEPETGKTTLAMQCAVSCALQGQKTLFLDCDHTFSTERLSQISRNAFERVAEQIILMRPNDFAEQTVIVDNLNDYISKDVGLIIIDTFNSLYRVKLAETSTKASFGLNRELNRQMALLAQYAKTQRIPIVVTSQVKSLINESFVSVAPVATRVLQFWADNIIALKPTEQAPNIQAVLEKNRNPQEATCHLRITQYGIHDAQ